MPTIKDVAKLSGFSSSTVSRALNNSGYVDPKTQKKILKAVQQLNYRPNYTAMTLSKKSSETIGFIVPEINNPFFSELISCIFLQAEKIGYRVIISISQNLPEKELEAIDFMKRVYIDGIIVATCGKMNDALADQSIPIVAVDRPVPNLPSVASDNYQGGILSGQILADCGVKKVLCVTGPEHLITADLRIRGLTSVLDQHNIPYKICYGKDELWFDKEMIQGLLGTREYDGLYTWNGVAGANALKCIEEMGLNMPRDIQFVSSDGTMISDLLSIPVTTVVQNIIEMGTMSVDMLFKLIKREKLEQKEILLPMHLVNGKTTTV